jgi:hypothetical protein
VSLSSSHRSLLAANQNHKQSRNHKQNESVLTPADDLMGTERTPSRTEFATVIYLPESTGESYQGVASLALPATGSAVFARIIEHNARAIHHHTGQKLHVYTLGDAFRQQVWGGRVPAQVELHEESTRELDRVLPKSLPCITPLCTRVSLKTRLLALLFTRHTQLVMMDADAIIVRPELLLVQHYDRLCTFAAMPRGATTGVPFKDVSWNRPTEFNVGVFYLNTRKMNLPCFLEYARETAESLHKWDDQLVVSGYVIKYVKNWSLLPYRYNCRWFGHVFVRISLGEHEHTILREHCYAIHMRRDHKENLLLHHFDERTFGSLELLSLFVFVSLSVCVSLSSSLSTSMCTCMFCVYLFSSVQFCCVCVAVDLSFYLT